MSALSTAINPISAPQPLSFPLTAPFYHPLLLTHTLIKKHIIYYCRKRGFICASLLHVLVDILKVSSPFSLQKKKKKEGGGTILLKNGMSGDTGKQLLDIPSVASPEGYYQSCCRTDACLESSRGTKQLTVPGLVRKFATSFILIGVHGSALESC